MAYHPEDKKYPEFDLRFRTVHRWASSRGWFAGFPNCHSANYNDGRGTVYGTHLLQANVVDWHDVKRTSLSNVAFDDYRLRLTTAHAYAQTKGYDLGFPNFEQANYGQGAVYGTFLIKKGFTQWRDVKVTDLGIPAPPTVWPMQEWFRRVAVYATKNGFPAGMPNGNYANYGGTWVVGVHLFNPGSITWNDVPGAELGYATAPSTGVTRLFFSQDPNDPFLFKAWSANPALKGARIATVKNTSKTRPKPDSWNPSPKYAGLGLVNLQHTDAQGKTIGPVNLNHNAGTGAFGGMLLEGTWQARAASATGGPLSAVYVDRAKSDFTVDLEIAWNRP